MTVLAGMLQIEHSDRVQLETVGQSVVFDAVQAIFEAHNQQMQTAAGIFVAGQTTDHKVLYKMSGSGYHQRLTRQGLPEAIKPVGEWTVEFPLEGWGDAMINNDIDLAYATISDIDRIIQTIRNRNINTYRKEMLTALFRNTNRTFNDNLRGSLTVKPLANGDADKYPPIAGSMDTATANHYLVSGYAAGSFSATNDPIASIVNSFEDRYGDSQHGENIVCFMPRALADEVAGLTGFVKVEDQYIRQGDDKDVPINLPNVPGTIVGRYGGAWIVKWRWIPANYILGVHMEEEAPLVERVDSVESLRGGLQLVANDVRHPFTSSYWRHRFGLGVRNRLNGVVMFIDAGASYVVPTIT